jgi:hypothetical protein
LLNAAELSAGARDARVAEVEIVNPELLVKLALPVGWSGEEAEHHAIAVAHQETSDRVAPRISSLQPRAEEKLRGAEHTGGQNDPASPELRADAGARIDALHALDAPARLDELGSHGMRPELQSALEQRRENVRCDVVLGADRARVGIARRAGHAARAIRKVRVVDR